MQYQLSQAGLFGRLFGRGWGGRELVFQDEVSIGPTEGFVQGHSRQAGLRYVEKRVGHMELESPDNQRIRFVET